MPSNPVFFDSHCHFDFPAFAEDRDTVWQACLAHGVKGLVIPGVEPGQWPLAAQLCEKNESMFYGAGIHPWWIERLPHIQEKGFIEDSLRQQLADRKCVAIGECGLDAMIATPLSDQLSVFHCHLQLASQLRLPLIIHCRKAHNELLQQLKKFSLSATGVVHAFSGSSELAGSYWAMGFCLGIGGTITYARAEKTRAAVKHLPIEAIVLETDAPDMPLQGQQGQRNSPVNIPFIAQALAEIRGESVEYIARQTSANARRLFALPEHL
ncbi:MAG TPA: TatD family hydrolase [Cellvibrio sp.]|nr:TatD family hydrolase [Cellvibrio sp.]